MYDKYKTEDQPLVAYKGGQAVKDTLKKLGIDAINLEHWGCRKIQSLIDPDTEPPEEDCGHHQRGYCATVKCVTFRQWLEWAKNQENLHSTLGNNDFWDQKIKKKILKNEPAVMYTKNIEEDTDQAFFGFAQGHTLVWQREKLIFSQSYSSLYPNNPRLYKQNDDS